MRDTYCAGNGSKASENYDCGHFRRRSQKYGLTVTSIARLLSSAMGKITEWPGRARPPSAFDARPPRLSTRGKGAYDYGRAFASCLLRR